ncbi:MAG: hypothetical protein KGL92_00825 [Gammaproteobacteria bacterium]|nr:hypothetical protein [Gammaproteobacteria bacterium]MDE2347022.1 hypothetical protein [Gammaproteobacteria bacterium]
MSEVDRLSNSGLYPMLPIADAGKQRDSSKDNPPHPQPQRQSEDAATTQTGVHRIPKSLIDDYA